MGEFEALLEEHQLERHRGILSRLPRRRRVVAPRDDDFLPLAEAAVVMQVTEAELVEMVARGSLDARKRAGQWKVRPAIVSTLHVRTIESGDRT